MTVRRKKDNVFNLGLVFLLASVIVIIVGHYYQYDTFKLKEFIIDFYANIGAELGSIAITIIIVDRIVRRQEEKESTIQIKNKLLNDLHSPVNSIANNAVHELRTLGKLTGQDAWTISAKLGGKADLTNARLYDANFYGARLIGANFSSADLRNANFYDADLTGANLFDADITGSKFNENTVLPDGHSWNKDTDLSKYIFSVNTFKGQNWLNLIDILESGFDDNDLNTQKVNARNLILYLQKQFPNSKIAENELHFSRHWTALSEFDYKTISDVNGLLERTKEARMWIWKDNIPEYLIIHISFSIALENPEHINLQHWNSETKDKIKEARKIFYNQSS